MLGMRRSADGAGAARPRRAGRATAAALAAAMLAGCAWVNAGSDAQREFLAELDARHGQHVVDTRVVAQNDMPGMGGASGYVVLDDAISDADLLEVLGFVSTFQPSRGGWVGTGVVANGVGICIGDPDAQAKTDLRSRLQAAGASLEGEWPCATATYRDQPRWSGTLAQLDADIATIAAVGPGQLRLQATTTDVEGTVDVGPDALPTRLAATLDAVAAETDVVAYRLVERALTVAVTTSADLSPVQAAADAAAVGALDVTVSAGSLDPTQAAQHAELGPIVDALRAIPGVEEVTTMTQAVTIRTLDRSGVRAIHDAAIAHPELDELGFRIVVGESRTPGEASEWFRPLGGESAHIDAFATLVAQPGVASVRVDEASASTEVWVALRVEGPLVDVVDLKGVLPMGVSAQLASVAEDGAVRLRLEPRLDAADVSDLRDVVDVDAFVAAWNAAP